MAAGNATIGSLKVLLGLDSAQFESGLKKSKLSLDGFGKAAAVAGVAVATAMVAAAAALGVAVKGVIDNADELSKTAQKVGVSVEALSKLKYAADLSDVSLDGLSTGLRRLAASMSDVAGGRSSKAADAFKALGISVTDASGKLKSSDAVLAEVATKFAGTADGANKTAIAMALFGKSGADLIPLLNSGAAGLKEMGDEAAALGVVIDEKTGKSAEAFNDNLTRLKTVFSGITTQIAARLLPTLEMFSALLVSAAKDTRLMDLVASALSGTLKVLASAAVVVGLAFKNTGVIVGSFAKAVTQVFAGDFGGAFQTIETGFKQSLTNIGSAAGAIKTLWTGVGSSVAKSAPKISADLATPISGAAKKIKEGADKAAEEAKRALEKLRSDVQGVIDGLQTDEERYIQSVADRMRKLGAARDAGIISERAYWDAVARIQAEGEARQIVAKKFDHSVEFENTPETLAKAAAALRDNRSEAERLADTFYDVADAVAAAFGNFRNGDILGALIAVQRAVASIQKAFASGSLTDKIGAAGGLAQGVGSAIGGTAGGLLGGIGGGAAAGASLGSIIPGVGTVIGAGIGAVLGGISSLFGSSKAKKAKKAAEAQAAAEKAAQEAAAEAARLQDIANQKRELELQIMEASGDAVGALAERRKDELAALGSDENRDLAKQLYALKDAADAAAKALAVTNERHGLEIELMEATGDSAGALAAKRADELAGLDASNKALKEAIYAAEDYAAAQDKANDALKAANDLVGSAQDALAAARDREAAQLQTTIDKFQAFHDSLKSFRESLNDVPTGATGYGAASSAFARVAGLAKLGNEDALGSLQGVSEKFLAVSKASAKTQLDYLRDQAKVKAAVEAAAATAGRTASVAEQQLASLNSQVDALLNVNTSVLSVRDAVVGLQAALSAQSAAQLATIMQAPVFNIPTPPAANDVVSAVAAQTAPATTADVAAQAQAIANLTDIATAQYNLFQRVTRNGDSLVVAA